tara:strand:+ start:2255 stop:2569 length:315 start_codon:yes stop_codon:yes gene_type:complete
MYLHRWNTHLFQLEYREHHMSTAKKVLLVVYAILAALVLVQGDTVAGVWALRLLAILFVIHLLETAVYFNLCKAAPGSLGKHLFNVFVFGVLHVNELKAAQPKP